MKNKPINLNLLNKSARIIEKEIQKIDSPDEIRALIESEQLNKNRKTVFESLASRYQYLMLKEKGFKCDFDSVEFPKPRDLVEMKIGGAILIELPPSRGYTVVEESLLFDHHTETGLFLVTEGGRLKALVKIEPFPSVARLVSVLLDINLE